MKTFRLLLLLLFVSIEASGYAAAGTAVVDELIPRRLLFSPSSVLTPKLSPDGRQVAFIRNEAGRRTLWLGEVSAPADARQLGGDVKGIPLNCWWTPRGDLLVVQYAVDGARQLICHDLEQGTSRNLTPLAKVQARLERMSHLHPGKILVGLNDRDPRVSDMYVVDLVTAEREKVIDGTGVRRIFCDANFVPRVAERLRRDGGIDLLRRTDDGQWEELATLDVDHSNVSRTPGLGVKGAIGVDALGRHLYVVDNSDRDKSALMSIEISTGAAKPVVADRDADVRALAVVDRFTGDVLAVSSHFGKLRRLSVDRSIADDLKFLEGQFSEPVGLSGVSVNDNSWLIVPFDGGPVRYLAFDRRARTIRPLFSTQPELDDFAMAERSHHIVEARDGVRLPCQLYLPSGTDADADGLPDEPLPCLLYVHGGPHIPNPWDSWFTNRNLQLLANRGYGVVNVDYRGSGGYGKDILAKGFGEWGGGIQRDIVDVARWTVEAGIAPEGKVGIWGWSFGGLSTFAALSFTPDEFACGVSMYGLSDMELFARLASLGTGGAGARSRVGDTTTEEGRERLRAQSPIHFAADVTRPLLVTHGGKDRTAPKSHSDQMVAALKKNGKSVTYLVYPDEPHDYRQPQSWISFWAVAERFLHEHLGGRYEPYGDDLNDVRMEVVEGADLIPGLKSHLERSHS